MTATKARLHSAEHIFWTFLKKRWPTIKTEAIEFQTDKVRLDYIISSDIDIEEIMELEQLVNENIRKNLIVETEVLARDKAATLVDLSLLPKTIQSVRLVKIGDISIEACIGEHVKNTSEIGIAKMVEIKKRGTDKLRIYLTVE